MTENNMLKIHTGNCLDWFNAYVKKFEDISGPNNLLVLRKKRHTMRVLAHVREIIKESGAGQELASAIEIATILHDIGRFPQITRKNTFDDNAGFNHAEEGAAILAQIDILDPVASGMKEVILNTVRYHNRATLPDGLGQEDRLALEVLRDADKLDSIRNNLKYLDPDAPHGKVLKSGLTWHNQKYSQEVYELARKRQLIPFKTITWSNDFILFLCCWIYDLHFPYSFLQLRDSGRFDELLSRLPETAEVMTLRSQLKDDLNWIIAKTRP